MLVTLTRRALFTIAATTHFCSLTPSYALSAPQSPQFQATVPLHFKLSTELNASIPGFLVSSVRFSTEERASAYLPTPESRDSEPEFLFTATFEVQPLGPNTCKLWATVDLLTPKNLLQLQMRGSRTYSPSQRKPLTVHGMIPFFAKTWNTHVVINLFSACANAQED